MWGNPTLSTGQIILKKTLGKYISWQKPLKKIFRKGKY